MTPEDSKKEGEALKKRRGIRFKRGSTHTSQQKLGKIESLERNSGRTESASGRLIQLQKKLEKKARLLNVENGWFQERHSATRQPRTRFREDMFSFKEANLTPEKAKKEGEARECRQCLVPRGSTQPIRS